MAKVNGHKRSQENLKDLLVELVKTDFKIRYNNSFLGFLWVLIRPFMMFTILYTVFSHFFGGGTGIENYPLYLLLGTITFQFFSEGTINGLHAILGKAGIILKVNFPKEIAVVSSTVIAIINYAINLCIFGVFAIIFKTEANIGSVLYFIFIIAMLYLLILTFGFIISILHVRFRDISPIWELTLQVLFYLTPIIYPMEFLNGWIYNVVALNPLTRIILSARSALIYGEIEFVKTNLIMLAIIIPAFFLSLYVFKKSIKGIAEKL